MTAKTPPNYYVDEYGDLIEMEASPPQPRAARPKPPKPMGAQRVAAFAGLFVGIVLFALGGVLWYQGWLKDNNQATQQASNALLQDKALTDDQRALYENLYGEASTAFNSGQLDQAIVNLKQIVRDAPNFKGSAAAFLFICYRGLALNQMQDATTDSTAMGTLDQSIGFIDQYQGLLRQQFSQNPNLLPQGFTDFDTVATNLRQQRGWFETYRQGESAAPGSGDTWFETAIARWTTIYTVNKNFLKESPERWVAARLVNARLAQSAYYCNTKKDSNKATAALTAARSITIETDQATPRKQIDDGLDAVNKGACQVAATPNR